VSARRILVTGGSGFIGSALKARCAGLAVRVFDDTCAEPCAAARCRARRRVVHGDIRDASLSTPPWAASTRRITRLRQRQSRRSTAPDLVLDVGVKGIVNVVDVGSTASDG
jgi:nucleoside-diphosphate-sugar epimerase